MGAQKTGMDQVPYRCLDHGSRNIPISRFPKMGVPHFNHLNQPYLLLKLQLFLGTSHFKKALFIGNHHPWRIHGAAIYGNMDPIHIPQSC